MLFGQIAIIVGLILLNGVFAMSELAVMSSRKARLQHMAKSGSRGAASALKLIDDPTRFLSTVQVGITLVGVVAGAYSGATLSEPLAEVLRVLPGIGPYADGTAFGLVVVTITYLSLVIGELVPKRIALNRAEDVAALVAPPMTALATIGAPVVWFLGVSTNGVLKILRIPSEPASTVTEEEVKSLIAEGTTAGVFKEAERELIEGVLRMADRAVRALMVPRPEVVWLDIEDDAKSWLDEIAASRHSRYLVSRAVVDDVVGVVHTKDLLEQQSTTGTVNLETALRPAMFVDERMPTLKLLDMFRTSSMHMAVVLDEHGSFEGIVTPMDILIAIAGDLAEEDDGDDPDVFQREDGSWLLDGRLTIDDLERRLDVNGISADQEYTTLAGFMLRQFGHLPTVGEHFVWQGWRFEVIDLDGRRIDKVLVTRVKGDDEDDDA